MLLHSQQCQGTAGRRNEGAEYRSGGGGCQFEAGNMGKWWKRREDLPREGNDQGPMANKAPSPNDQGEWGWEWCRLGSLPGRGKQAGLERTREQWSVWRWLLVRNCAQKHVWAGRDEGWRIQVLARAALAFAAQFFSGQKSDPIAVSKGASNLPRISPYRRKISPFWPSNLPKETVGVLDDMERRNARN